MMMYYGAENFLPGSCQPRRDSFDARLTRYWGDINLSTHDAGSVVIAPRAPQDDFDSFSFLKGCRTAIEDGGSAMIVALYALGIDDQSDAQS
jgi:hypothetical protein